MKLNSILLKSASWSTTMSMRCPRWILFGTVLALIILSQSFAENLNSWTDRNYPYHFPKGQPAQMSSKVDYDPDLTDPFFEPDDWAYPLYINRLPDGTFMDTVTGERFKNPPPVTYTAKCFADRGDRESAARVRFCDVRLHDVNRFDLFIREKNASSDNALLVRIRNGQFSCQYWGGFYPDQHRLDGEVIWTTIAQRLTLDKKVYRKGDLLKGRINFVCRQEPADFRAAGISGWRGIKRLQGVFKAIVE